MSLILGIETSTKICSVALSNGDDVLALKEEGGAYSHAEKLTSFIDVVLEQAGKKLSDLNAVAISKGPGSYTGLRIGVSAAKGLCYALNIPLISVNTLQAMALGINEPNCLRIPMIDARRMEVYTAVFDEQNKEILPVSAQIIDSTSFATLLDQNKVILFGDGAEKCSSLLQHKNISFSSEGLPSAQHINTIAQRKLKKKMTEDVAYFEPYYLKDFIATTPKKLI